MWSKLSMTCERPLFLELCIQLRASTRLRSSKHWVHSIQTASVRARRFEYGGCVFAGDGDGDGDDPGLGGDPDDLLYPLQKLEKYMDSDNVFTRWVARSGKVRMV